MILLIWHAHQNTMKIGYFGHANCSDNLNDSLEKYGVQRKRGWHAINLFFNTSAGGQNSVLSDESYARPGDYVILEL